MAIRIGGDHLRYLDDAAEGSDRTDPLSQTNRDERIGLLQNAGLPKSYDERVRMGLEPGVPDTYIDDHLEDDQ